MTPNEPLAAVIQELQQSADYIIKAVERGDLDESERWLSVTPERVQRVCRAVDQQRDTIDQLREELFAIHSFASAHHAEQPGHVLLHGLTVDIPEMCLRALRVETLTGEPARGEPA